MKLSRTLSGILSFLLLPAIALAVYAVRIDTQTGSFNGLLSPADTTVQSALETLDNFTESDPLWRSESGSKLDAGAKAADSDLLDGHDTAYFQPAGSYLTTESDPLWRAQSGAYLTTAAASTTYLNISSKAADSDLLDNHDTSYFQIAGSYQSSDTDLTSLASGITGIVKGNGNGAGYQAAIAGDFPTLNQNTTGNAATATALAANPSDCSVGEFANAIAANGNLTCAAAGGGSPGGSTTEIQYNSGGAFAGSELFTFSEITGAEKLKNGTFTGNATYWTVGTGWAYNTNLVRKQSDGTAALQQSNGVFVTTQVAGQEYELTFTISNWTVGTVTPTCGGATLTARGANGTYTERFLATSTANLVFTPTSTARFYIDTISLKQVTGTITNSGGTLSTNLAKTNKALMGSTTTYGNGGALQVYGTGQFPNTSTAEIPFTIIGAGQEAFAFYDTSYRNYVGYAKGDSAGNLAFGAKTAVVFESGGFGGANEAWRTTANRITLFATTAEEGTAKVQVAGSLQSMTGFTCGGTLTCAALSEAQCNVGGCSATYSEAYCDNQVCGDQESCEAAYVPGYCSGNEGCETYGSEQDCIDDYNYYGNCGWTPDYGCGSTWYPAAYISCDGTPEADCSQFPNSTCEEYSECSVGTTTPSFILKNDLNSLVQSISNDGTNQVFDTSTGVGYFSGQVSATGYTTRSSVYDKAKGKALDWIKDASAYLDKDGKIDHTKFYGYTTITVPDTSKPAKKTKCIQEGEKGCIKTTEVTYYPETKEEGGVSLGMEVDVLRQAVFELNEKVTALEKAAKK